MTEFISRKTGSGWHVDELQSGEARFDVYGNLRRPDGRIYAEAIGPAYIVGERGVGNMLTLFPSPGWGYTGIQWMRYIDGVGSPISGQTGATYTQVEQDVLDGVDVRATVTGHSFTAFPVGRAPAPVDPVDPDPDPEPNPTPPSINGTPPGATVGVMFTFTPSVTGGTGSRSFSLTSGSLSGTGLSQNSFTGTISGAPTTMGAISVRIRVTDSLNLWSELNITINVAAAALDTRPRWFNAPSTAASSGTQAYIDGATKFGSNGGKAGTFVVITTAGNYGWAAVPAGAGTPTFTHVATGATGGWVNRGNFTAANGTVFSLWQQDYPNSSPAPGVAWSIA